MSSWLSSTSTSQFSLHLSQSEAAYSGELKLICYFSRSTHSSLPYRLRTRSYLHVRHVKTTSSIPFAPSRAHPTSHSSSM